MRNLALDLPNRLPPGPGTARTGDQSRRPPSNAELMAAAGSGPAQLAQEAEHPGESPGTPS